MPNMIDLTNDDSASDSDDDAMSISSSDDDESNMHTLTSTQLQTKVNTELEKSTVFPDELPVKEEIGKLALMNPRTYARSHPATPLLDKYAATGCPVDCGPDWPREHIEALLRSGPHPSAKAKAAIQQLRTETKDKVHHGYARVVRWKDIKDSIPKRLKISPVAMIPHKSKAYRCILDLTFRLRYKGILLASVNHNTNKLAKAQAMTQLGQSLRRIVTIIADHWSEDKPFLFAKLDIKDGFWRMAVNDDDAWNFCYVLPSLSPINSLDDIELVVPNSLQMGWCESPPFFCSGTETARDVIQRLLSDTTLPAHKFEDVMMSTVPNSTSKCAAVTSPMTLEVFVDDFIAAVQTNDTAELRQTSRAMLHGIHAIFPPPDITKHNGYDPVSEKKLHQGEGKWETKKEILGWDIDGASGTIQLPPKKCKIIHTTICKILKKKSISLNKFQKIAGKLQHASFGIPGGKGLFSPLQMALHGSPQFITITDTLKSIFTDWKYIINYMKNNLTSVQQLVPKYPSYLGYSDACKLGAGGVWCSGTEPLQPFLWQVAWPADIQEAIITDQNPNGSLTINDLELAGAVLQWLALELQNISLKFKHVGTFCDNTSAVAWAYKLRTSSSIVAARLLRFLSIRIHCRQASGLTPLHIPGEDNDMADIISRAFKDGKFFAAAQNLTHYFNLHFPLPQQQSWHECQLPPRLVSLVIACLRGEPLAMESLLRLPKLDRNTGRHGTGMPPPAELTQCSKTSPHCKETSPSMPSLHGSGAVLTEEELKSKFKASRMQFRPSPRPSNWLDNPAPSTEKMGRRTT